MTMLPETPLGVLQPEAEETVSLSGKLALVTGSTSGIGLSIARALAVAGTHVALNGFGDKAQVDRLVAEFRTKYKVKVDYSAADMSKPAEIAAMVEQVARELGRVDILVNNAGIQHVAPVEEFPLEKWDAVIATSRPRFSPSAPPCHT
jgi:3-hydroxybutyrate dehydrogenase